ncbi:AAA domain-containing protein [Pseudoalteromonas aurantia]|uniref:AAA+ ATPase domain-containing protein n=2 Tax=Pseudoalteromonas TaxID=53246 RepID=A0ABY2VUD9_9GAMM|nr:AAA domain-containing protein [Pseudoalteromonas aurantia]TMO56527.1 hypothetical protein CWC18_19460 [Pseudoalteromonas aurantia]TMO71925.1 hypothetical protein CWC20_16355 [Pseudoalteromonas aurantia]
MNPFYLAISDNKNEKAASRLAETVDKGLFPFNQYLKNSITAFKDKETECKWKPLATSSYEISPTTRIYRIMPLTKLKVMSGESNWYQLNSDDLDEDFEFDTEEPVTVGKGKNRKRIEVCDSRIKAGKHEIRLKDELTNITEVSWLGYSLLIMPISLVLKEGEQLSVEGRCYQIKHIDKDEVLIEGEFQSDSATAKYLGTDIYLTVLERFEHNDSSVPLIDFYDHYVVYGDKIPSLKNTIVEDITDQELRKFSLSNCYDKQGNLLPSKDYDIKYKQSKILIEPLKANTEVISRCNLAAHPSLNLTITKIEAKELWIQLIEPDDDEGLSISLLDLFFSDNAKILEANTNNPRDAFYVVKAKQDEKQLLLAKSKETKNKSVFPKGETIKVKADISQLRKQQNALTNIKKAPSIDQIPIINLFLNKKDGPWQPFEPEELAEGDWGILTDLKFKGCEEQREFVQKALATPDVAILDGPPGTGKTTSILELILQLVRKGKRVLLTASTHAAINNVLERVDSKKLDNEIFPLRIGDKHNAQGLEHYQIDELETTSNLSKQLLVESSNLVCGTTIGIMRLFNDESIRLSQHEAPFDVMIIDESSKTPFQEFLVPALYAKKHILVGDIKQLSPFTDRDQIVANLENLMLKQGRINEKAQTLDKALQQACFLLEECRGTNRENDAYKNYLIKKESRDVCSAIKAEVDNRRRKDKDYQNVLVIERNNLSEIIRNPLELWQKNLCFIEESCFEQIQAYLPPDAILLSDNNESSSQSFQHNAIFNDNQKLHYRGKDINTTTNLHKHFNERFTKHSWATEVCWRLERLYWLRLANGFDKKARSYKSTIERLLPSTVDCAGRVFQLNQIAFPSVLEALSGSGLDKRKNDIEHTLNSGFSPNIKNQRHVTLSYQHRMHPDISKFPGKQFYGGRSLNNGDSVSTERDWDYKGFTSHATWCDVNGSVEKGNKNKAEVRRITQELQKFASWAEGKTNDEGKPYSIAVLTFYKGQESALREALKTLTNSPKSYSRFEYKGLPIKLATVDYFQGQEADIVFLSMVNTHRDGFLDSPNRLNVAITRARYQLAVVGSQDYFENKSRSDELKGLAESLTKEGK